MPYVLICLMVGLAIVALTLTIVSLYDGHQTNRRRRSADRIWKESDR
jgi:hypothetical protein